MANGIKTDPIIEAKARKLWADGYQRKFIAKQLGIAERTVTRICADLPKPIEHRGRKRHSKHSLWTV